MEKRKNRSIVIINQDAGYLMIDIANAFVANGFKVTLIAGRIVQRNVELDQSIKVLKIIRYNRDSTLKRLGTWSIGFLQILFFVWFKLGGKKLLIVTNPPFATLIPFVSKNEFSLLIYDIYPDSLVNMNILKESSLIIKKWKSANRKIFKKATTIFTLNEGMKNVLTNYGEANKIKVVPIWTDNTFLRPIPKKENTFIKELHLEGKFIVQYSGNLGKTHPVEKLLDVAEILRDDAYAFVIIGGGEKFKSIEKELRVKSLHNVTLLPWQPVEKIPITLAAADIGVVTLGVEASNLSIPSKTYNLLSVGAPILSIASKSSALASLVISNKIGENFEENEINRIANYIKRMHLNKLEYNAISNNSIKLSLAYTSKNTIEFID